LAAEHRAAYIIMRNFKTKKGFTLIETLLAVGIFLVVMLALANFAKYIFSFSPSAEHNLSAQSEAKQTLDAMSSALRSMYASDTGAYAIGQAGTSSIIFYSDINNDGKRERIRYFLSGTTLEKGVTASTGNPLSYNLANEKITIAVHNIANGQAEIFDYFDGSYDGTTAPLAQPVVISSIRLVKITMIINAGSAAAPNPVTFSTQVTLRNLKDNL
jgi:prepilin-type N-terminal cleavage/methylation domain-containing protein